MKNILTIIFFALSISIYAQKPRARDLGIQFEGSTGKYNAITDVKGVSVGHSTIISGNGMNELGKGPIRTGVTAIFPSGKRKNLCMQAGIV